MNGPAVFVTMLGAGLVYAMFTSQSTTVRFAQVGSRKYRVTVLNPNLWRIERFEGTKVYASADLPRGQDLTNTAGDTATLRELANDIMYFPSNLLI